MDRGSLRRVAILIDSLDDTTASRLLAMMPAERAASVRKAVLQLSDVDPLERKMAIADFMQKSHSAPPESPSPPTQNPALGKPLQSTEFFDSLPSSTLIEVLSHEHPQTVAVVLASMQPRSAANILQQLPNEIRAAALSRMGRLNQVPQQAIQEISDHIRSMTSDAEGPNSIGSRSVTSILVHLQEGQRGEILSELASIDPSLAAQMPKTKPQAEPSPPKRPAKREAFAASSSRPTPESTALDFGPIESLPPDALRRVLSRVNVESAILSLCGMKPQIVQRVLAQLPKSQNVEVMSRLKAVENLKLRDIDRAQAHVYEAALAMKEKGQLPELQTHSHPNRLSIAG